MLLGFCERHRLDCRQQFLPLGFGIAFRHPSFACSLYSGGTRLVLDCRSLKHGRLNDRLNDLASDQHVCLSVAQVYNVTFAVDA
jgi:hypothetical protein